MAISLQEAQREGACLRFPEQLGVHRELSYDMAVNMLLRATQMATTIPFTWTYLDKLPEGSVALIFLPHNQSFPNDGIRWQDNETKFSIPVASGRELEVAETKYGFIPGGQDPIASRFRRRYRLLRGGHPQLILVHYIQGPQTAILPNLNHPVRQYPLRPVNEPAIYVAGDKLGQKAIPHGISSMPSGGPQIQQPGMPMHLQQQQAMIAQQNNSMELLERRRAEERAAAAARGRGPAPAARGPHPPDDDSGDEHDQISTRTLALSRYRRNHELMNEVFHHAAFSDKKATSPPKPYSIFNKDDLDEKARKLQEEIDALKNKKIERRPVPTVSTDVADVSMSDGIAV